MTTINTNKHEVQNGVYVTLDELFALKRLAARSAASGKRRVQSAIPGDIKSRAHGHGIEFEEVRPYQAGDDIRTIDWRVSARTGKPFTKLFAEERERPIYLAVDQRVNMFFGSSVIFKSVMAAHLAALIGWRSLAVGDRIGGLIAGESIQRIRSSTRRRTLLQFLQITSDANNNLHALSPGNVSLDQILRSCLLHTTTGTTITIFSDFQDIDNQTLQSLTALSRQRKVIILKINDPLEINLPTVSGAGIGNGIDTANVFINKQQQQLLIEQKEHDEQLLRECLSHCSARLIQVSTNDDTNAVLNRYVTHS